MKTGLVLEGGAMRGMFTAGVLDVLMEHNIQLDGAVGVSAGAEFGCDYKSHQIGRTIRYNTEYCTDKRYASFGNLLRTGNLYSEQFCYHTEPEKLDPFDTETFRENPMDFFVVCTDVRTGDPIYRKCRTGDAEDIQWMQASASSSAGANGVGLYSLYGTAPGTPRGGMEPERPSALARRALPKRFMAARSEASGRPRPMSGLRQCCATNAAAPSVTHPAASPSVLSSRSASS